MNEYTNAIAKGFIKGALIIGAPISVGLGAYLQRRTNFWKIAGTFPKVLTYAAPIIFSGITSMEYSSRQFEQLEREKHGEKAIKTSPSEAFGIHKIIHFVNDNKYKCIVAGWAATLGGCFWAVNRDPYMSRSQKIVQARVYAQGITVIMLVASVVLTLPSKKNPKQVEHDKAVEASRSWERDLQYVTDSVPSSEKNENPSGEKKTIQKSARGETTDDKPYGEPSGEKPTGKPSGQKPSGEKPSGEKPPSQKPSENPTGEK